MKENLKIKPVDLEIFPVGEKDNGDGGDRVNNHGFHGQISVPKAISDPDGALMPSEITICQEFTQSLSLDAEVQKSFYKCNSFPVSAEMHAYSLFTYGRANSSNAVTQGHELISTGTSAYSRSISLPSSSTLVSAMKGGRALNGTAAKLDLQVKWAPEVYEPAATLTSRPNSKKNVKRKYKGKSSPGNGNERKRGEQKSSSMTKPTNFSKSEVADALQYNSNGEKEKMWKQLFEGRTEESFSSNWRGCLKRRLLWGHSLHGGDCT